MKLIRTYALFSMLIGVFQGLLGLTLINNHGAVNAISQSLAMIELFWVLVSMAVIIMYQQKGVRFLSPLAYILFNLSIWIVGAVIWALGGGREYAQVPFWFSASGILFGGWFGLNNHRLYCRLNASEQYQRQHGVTL